MVDLLNSLKHTWNLNQVNVELSTIMQSDQFRQTAERVLVHDREYYLASLRQSLFVVVEMGYEGDEPDHTCNIDEQFFQLFIKSEHDILVHLLHMIAHEKCNSMWRHSPVRKRLIPSEYLHFFEEMFIQRMIKDVAPTMHSKYPAALINYQSLKGINIDQQFAQIHTLLTDRTTCTSQKLVDIHTFLYDCDLVDSDTFNQYMAQCALIVQDSEVQMLAKKYSLT